jgi:hypothetical protein
MSMRLARLRDEVRHEIGQLGTKSTIDDAAIDHALAQSLMLLASHYPSSREILTIEAAGSTQDLRALAPTMVKLESIQYPYNPDNLRMLSYPHTIVDAHTVVFYGVEPQAGEELLAVFNERHTLTGLFKDEANTLPETDEYEHPLILAAVGHLLALEATRLTISPDKAAQAASRPLRSLADDMTSQAIDEAIALGAAAQNPAWSNIGL